MTTTDDIDIARLADDGSPLAVRDADPAPCCGAAAELAAIHERAAAVLARPWEGAWTSHGWACVREVRA